MKTIQVLGPGCPSCDTLFELTTRLVESLQLDYEVSKVTAIDEITSFGVMSTPALVVNGEVMVSGRVPSEAELKEMIV